MFAEPVLDRINSAVEYPAIMMQFTLDIHGSKGCLTAACYSRLLHLSRQPTKSRRAGLWRLQARPLSQSCGVRYTMLFLCLLDFELVTSRARSLTMFSDKSIYHTSISQPLIFWTQRAVSVSITHIVHNKGKLLHASRANLNQAPQAASPYTLDSTCGLSSFYHSRSFP